MENFKREAKKALRVVVLIMVFGIVVGGGYEKVYAEVNEGESKDVIINGGAERGWYMTGRIPSIGGETSQAWQEHEWKIEKGGYKSKYCFRIDCDKRVKFRGLYFNPVEMRVGKPYYLSVYAKSSVNGARLYLTLYRSSGAAYSKMVRLTTEWKQYIMRIDNHGKKKQKDPGVSVIGNVKEGRKGTGIVKVLPRIVPADNTVYWIDNVQAGPGLNPPLMKKEELLIRGQAKRDNFEYESGETIEIPFEIENNSLSSVKVLISYQIKDYFNTIIGKKVIGEYTLKKDEIKKIPVKLEIRQTGPFNIEFKVKAKNKEYLHVVRVNIIKPFSESLPDNKGVGLDLSTTLCPYIINHDLVKSLNYLGQTKFLVNVCKKYGIGMIRFWNNRHLYTDDFIKDSYTAYKIAKKAGIKTYVTISKAITKDIKNPWVIPKDPNKFSQVVRDIVEGHEDLFDYVEILNEPNIWGGRMKNIYTQYEDVSIPGYVRILKAASETIKKLDRRIKVAGPTATGSLGWIEDVLREGGRYLDAVSFHSYQTGPDCPDFQEELKTIRNCMKRYGVGDKELIQSECNWLQSSITNHWQITPYQRDVTEKNVKAIIIGYANKLNYYALFNAKVQNIGGTTYTVWMAGNSGNHVVPIAQPVLLAIKALQDQLLNADFFKEIYIADVIRCYLFKKGDEFIAPFWVKDERYYNKKMDLKFIYNGAVKLVDLMGNQKPIEKKGTQYTVPLSKTPAYLHFKGNLLNVENALLSATVTGLGFVAHSTYKVLGPDKIKVTVKNTGSRIISGTVSFCGRDCELIRPRSVRFELKKGEKKEIICELTKPLEMQRKMEFSIKTVVDGIDEEWEVIPVKLQAYLCKYTNKKITIDGDLSEWEGVEPIVLDHKNIVVKGDWKDASNFKANVRALWNEEGLYLAVVVYDKIFYQDMEKSGIWKGDSLQVAFDTLQNGGEKEYKDDDFEYGIALTPNGVQVYCFAVSSSAYDGFTGKKIGLVNLPAAVKREDGKTIYEVQFLPNWLSPFQLEAGRAMNWDIIVNNNDGKGRTGWLELTPGIGQIPKAPGKFSTIILVH